MPWTVDHGTYRGCDGRSAVLREVELPYRTSVFTIQQNHGTYSPLSALHRLPGLAPPPDGLFAKGPRSPATVPTALLRPPQHSLRALRTALPPNLVLCHQIGFVSPTQNTCFAYARVRTRATKTMHGVLGLLLLWLCRKSRISFSIPARKIIKYALTKQRLMANM